MNEYEMPTHEYLGDIRLDRPEHEWLRVIAEVYTAARPDLRPRTVDGGMDFPASEPGHYGKLDSRELWVLAAWHLKEFYALSGQMDVGEQFDGSDRRNSLWHHAALCAIHAILGTDFEERLCGLISRLSDHTDEWAEEARSQVGQDRCTPA